MVDTRLNRYSDDVHTLEAANSNDMRVIESLSTRMNLGTDSDWKSNGTNHIRYSNPGLNSRPVKRPRPLVPQESKKRVVDEGRRLLALLLFYI